MRDQYRDNMVRLNEVFPDRDVLNLTDISRFTGMTPRTVRRNYPFSGKYISKADFSRLMYKGACIDD